MTEPRLPQTGWPHITVRIEPALFELISEYVEQTGCGHISAAVRTLLADGLKSVTKADWVKEHTTMMNARARAAERLADLTHAMLDLFMQEELGAVADGGASDGGDDDDSGDTADEDD